MPRFMIEVPHSSEKRACLNAVEVFLKTGSHYMTHCDWGCLAGEHKAWITVETASREEAMRIVPPMFRADAKVTELNRFTLEQIEGIMASHSG